MGRYCSVPDRRRQLAKQSTKYTKRHELGETLFAFLRVYSRIPHPYDTLTDDLAAVIESTGAAAFNVPTLIVHGTADKTVPIDASARAAARGIANANLIEYDGAPHGLFATHKDQLTKNLLAFLQEGGVRKRAVNQA